MTRFSLFNFFRPLTRLFRRDAPVAPRRRRAVPRLESLEDRRVPSCNTVSGFVFNDANANGLFDAGEKPIANSPIQLFNSSGVVVGSTMTDATGHYEFEDDSTLSTTPTTLERDLVFANGKTDFTQTQGLAQFNPALGTLNSIEIRNAGDLTSQIRVENLDRAPATITGTVSGTLTLSIPGQSPLVTNNSASETFAAAAFDGGMDFAGASGHDFGEKTASGSKSVTLTSAAALAQFTGTGTVPVTESAHATSSASGAGNLLTQINSRAGAHVMVIYHYTPSNCLRAGSYKIVQTHEPAGFLDGKESQNGVVIPGSIGTDTIPVVLTSSGNSVNNNFGEVLPVELCGSVYLDANNDGIKQSTEKGIAGVTIRLTGTNDAGQTISKTAVTLADGSFDFAGLRPGTYTLTEVQPAGYFDGKDTIGTVPGTVLPDQFASIRVANGAQACNNNFGELLPTSVSGFVYVDSNNDGIFEAGELPLPGVVVILSGTGDMGAFTLIAVTGPDGSYSFTNLKPAVYAIHELQPAGLLDGKDTLGNLGGVAFNDLFYVALGSGQKGVNYNFGELLPSVPPAVIPGPVVTPPSKRWLIDF